MTPQEIITEHYFEIGNALVRANILSPAGENIWVVFTDATATVETLGSQEWPQGWNADVTRAVHWGRAAGWESQDTRWWFEGLCHKSSCGYYVRDDTGEVIGDGAEEDAAKLALEVGDYSELIDEAIAWLCKELDLPE